MPRAAVLGTGLIGASIGIALRRLGWSVVGWDPDPAALRTAAAVGALDEMAAEAAEAQPTDLIVLAGPPAAIEETLLALDTDALVTDVAGVKAPMVLAGAHLARFVGGHPLAGRETSGPGGASGSLFQGATWVLTTDGADPRSLGELSELVSRFGAIPLHLSAAQHDEAVAAISHLPQVLASALVNRVARDPGALDLAAGGFRDLTRIALSSPAWWPDVLVENREPLAAMLRELGGDLLAWADILEEQNRDQIGAALLSARAARSSLTAPVASIGVVLEDRPGEIARVGHALEVSGVDLRDLQLRHATHGGGGVLTLSVRAAEAEVLTTTLRAEGFDLI
ncbi:MAG TPA: prephenate dehydrogenase/arogenate dehydrogenase family protein [Acidimicrobiia bacterium]|nr:prephenate dehydrogenase/arogenate dehydrogenase family protein [Acidimicrobiia bacterium]